MPHPGQMEAKMSVRNGLYWAMGLALLVVLTGATGCETAKEYNYYSEVKGAGPSTGQVTDVPQIMQQMREANLRLVDSLTQMNAQGSMSSSVQMYELSRALVKTQPAVALKSPDDVGKYRKLADDLAEIIVQVGSAARDNRTDLADWNYAQAFPLCNRCHMQFRVTKTPKSDIPAIEQPTTPESTPAPAGEVVPPLTAPAPAPGTGEVAPQ
jgi:hypothetical protein